MLVCAMRSRIRFVYMICLSICVHVSQPLFTEPYCRDLRCTYIRSCVVVSLTRTITTCSIIKLLGSKWNDYIRYIDNSCSLLLMLLGLKHPNIFIHLSTIKKYQNFHTTSMIQTIILHSPIIVLHIFPCWQSDSRVYSIRIELGNGHFVYTMDKQNLFHIRRRTKAKINIIKLVFISI